MHLAETLEHLLAVEGFLDVNGLSDAGKLHEALGNFSSLEDQHFLHLTLLLERVVDHIVA